MGPRGNQELQQLLVVPYSLGHEVLMIAHDLTDDFGQDRTLAILEERLHWKDMNSDAICRVCSCQDRFTLNSPVGKTQPPIPLGQVKSR